MWFAITSDSDFIFPCYRKQSELRRILRLRSGSHLCLPLYSPMQHVCSQPIKVMTTRHLPHLPPVPNSKFFLSAKKSETEIRVSPVIGINRTFQNTGWRQHATPALVYSINSFKITQKIYNTPLRVYKRAAQELVDFTRFIRLNTCFTAGIILRQFP